MLTRTVLVTGPTCEPIDLENAKLGLRVDGDDHDALISNLVLAARSLIQQRTWRRLITQTWDLYLDAFPGESEIEIPYPPLLSITGIFYTPDGSTEQTFASSNYRVDLASEPGRLVLKDTSSWPSNSLIEVNGVKIRFACGYGGTPEDVPEMLRQAAQLLVSQWYDSPLNYEVGPVMTVPYAVEALIAPYKVYDY